MVASFLTPGTDMDLLVRHRDLKLRLCTKLKTYFDFPTFIGYPSFQERPHTKFHQSENTEKVSLKFPLLNVYKMPLHL
jgi:hypothetical protein